MTRPMGGRRSVLAAAVTAALLAAGCGGDDKKAEPKTTAPATTAAPVGSPTVRVDYVDYGYSVSGPLTAGGTLQLHNAGKEFHMMGVGRFKEGKTLADLKDALSKAGPPGGGGGGGGAATSTSAAGTTATTGAGATTTTSGDESGGGGEEGGGGEDQNPTAGVLDEVGLPGNIMGPGQSAELTVPSLKAGNYGLICFIPAEGEGTPHFAKGMISELKVVDGPAPAPPAADATYKVAPGKAVEGPTTLAAGRHTLRVDAAPGSDQLEPAVAKANRGTTFDQLDKAINNLFEGDSPPPRNAAAQVPGQLSFGAFDLGDVTTFYLGLDFTPGTYYLVAEDSDKEDRPRPPKELATISVK